MQLVNRYKFCLCIVPILLIQIEIVAGVSKSSFPTNGQEDREVIVEYIYRYKLSTYTPSIEIKPLSSQSDASCSTPEDTAISHFSAMINKDYNWWLENWTREERKAIQVRNREGKVTPDGWKSRWDALKGRRIELLHRVDRKEYSFIAYRLKEDEKVIIESELPMVFNDNKWLITNEFRSHPVFLYWKEGKIIKKHE